MRARRWGKSTSTRLHPAMNLSRRVRMIAKKSECVSGAMRGLMSMVFTNATGSTDVNGTLGYERIDAKRGRKCRVGNAVRSTGTAV